MAALCFHRSARVSGRTLRHSLGIPFLGLLGLMPSSLPAPGSLSFQSGRLLQQPFGFHGSILKWLRFAPLPVRPFLALLRIASFVANQLSSAWEPFLLASCDSVASSVRSVKGEAAFRATPMTAFATVFLEPFPLFSGEKKGGGAR